MELVDSLTAALQFWEACARFGLGLLMVDVLLCVEVLAGTHLLEEQVSWVVYRERLLMTASSDYNLDSTGT
ncbi:hypothetical protein F5Y05DRAFT_368859 [Hypoxylon sp. FL0543]|nr:hypothetical protein F5Y05DRAFT_368859 [Hypoxylon sp. FL0543]